MRYIVKKMLTLFMTLLAVSFLVFLAFSVIPGDPATSRLGMEATPEKVEALREEMGLNRPLIVQYLSWVGGFLKGDLGTSYSYGMPVTKMIGDKFPITLTMTIMAFILLVMLAIPVGIYSAKYEGGLIDRFIYVMNQVTMSVPPFFMGMLLTFLFGLVLKWFVPGGYVDYKINMGKFLSYLIFPAVALALPKCAMTVKLLRSSVLSQSKLDYVRTAYSKGNTTDKVLYQHVLRNAMIPVITFLGMAFTEMIANSIIIEQVFGIPGIGRILLTSIANRDYPVVQGIIVWLAFIVIFMNFIIDFLYQWIDPRIRSQV